MTAPARPAHVEPVPLARLAALVGADPGQVEGVQVTGVALASTSVRRGDLYLALPGARTHGARFVPDAVAAGAVAVLTDADGAANAPVAAVPVLVVPHPRRVVGAVAAEVYGHPARRLTLVGVTGTHGKTTTTQLASAAVEASGRRTAVVGTMGTWIDKAPVHSALTTPEAPDLHALFAVMAEAGVDVCAIEVSSHALVMGRVDGVVFDLAVFTNFGRDHLDFHRDEEDYFQAKAQLFTPERSRRALLNADDPAVARLLDDPAVETATFSPAGAPANWRASDVELSLAGATFTLHRPRGGAERASTRLAGAFNVANALCALAIAGELGLDVRSAVRGLGSVDAVPGRMQRIDTTLGFSVVVDYAHKPDAVRAALRALRPVTEGRLVIVLGAGGDRDTGKRTLMGEAAAELADRLVVTDDNPRGEDPATIRSQLVAGARGYRPAPGSGGPEPAEVAEVAEVGDRREAIAAALRSARPGDTVLIAGKGHESGQDVAGTVVPFDDRQVARTILDEMTKDGDDR